MRFIMGRQVWAGSAGQNHYGSSQQGSFTLIEAEGEAVVEAVEATTGRAEEIESSHREDGWEMERKAQHAFQSTVQFSKDIDSLSL